MTPPSDHLSALQIAFAMADDGIPASDIADDHGLGRELLQLADRKGFRLSRLPTDFSAIRLAMTHLAAPAQIQSAAA